MADRIAVMRDGRIEQIGTPTEVYRYPETPFVSGFVGNVNRVRTSWNGDGTLSVFGSRVQGIGDGGARGEVIALIRPDDIALRADATGPGVVDSIVLRGPITSVNLTVDGADEPVRVDLASRDALGFRAGDRVLPSIDLDRVMLEAEQGAA